MNQQPKIKLHLSTYDKSLEVISIVLLFVVWGILIKAYSDLPEKVAVHFNALGNPDHYGSKKILVFLPLVSTFLYILLTLVNKIPHLFNYPLKITDANAEEQYTNATRLIRLIKLIILVCFGFIIYQVTQIEASGLGVYFLPIFLILIFGPLIYYYIKSKYL